MEKDAKQSSVKSRLAVCGSRFLSGVGAAAAATAVISPLLVPPEIAKETASVLLLTAATFSVAAQNVGNRNKTEKLHRLQNNFTKLALCGFAFLTGTSEVTEDMQRMDEINRVRPYVAKTEKPIDNDKLRQYWQKVIADKVISLEDLADIAAKTSAKDLQKAVNNRNASLTVSSSDKNAVAVLTYNALSRV